MNDNKTSKTKPYDRYLEWVKENPWAIEGMQTEKIKAEEIECIKYNKRVMSLGGGNSSKGIVNEKEITYYPDGRIVILNKIDNFKKVNGKKEAVYSPERIQKMFKDVAGFLSEKSLRLTLFYDDACATLSLCFKDGHVEKYDRGMGDGEDFLCTHIFELQDWDKSMSDHEGQVMVV